jgi:hypothetical protein
LQLTSHGTEGLGALEEPGLNLYWFFIPEEGNRSYQTASDGYPGSASREILRVDLRA